MKRINLERLGWVLMLSGVSFLVYWLLYAMVLPMQQPYINWVLDPDWTWVNAFGFTSSAFGVFAVIALVAIPLKKSAFVWIGFVLSIIGIIILTSVLFFEAFILKGIALENASMVIIGDGFYLHAPFQGANLAGGIMFSTGLILLSSWLIKYKVFKVWKLVLLMISCPLFSLLIMPPNLRLVGVLLYAVSFTLIGLEWKKAHNDL